MVIPCPSPKITVARVVWLLGLVTALVGCASSPVSGTPPPPSSSTSGKAASTAAAGTSSFAPSSTASTAPAESTPSIAAGGTHPVDANKQSEIILRHTDALQKAGDENRCDAEVERVRAALAADPGFTDADLERNARVYDTKDKGPMPYPSPGTACAIFGRVRALQGAINDRRNYRAK